MGHDEKMGGSKDIHSDNQYDENKGKSGDIHSNNQL